MTPRATDEILKHIQQCQYLELWRPTTDTWIPGSASIVASGGVQTGYNKPRPQTFIDSKTSGISDATKTLADRTRPTEWRNA